MHAAEVSNAKSWFHLSSVQIRRGRFKTNQHQCRAEEISRLAHCATPYIWDDNCCFETRTKTDTIPPSSWPLLSLETQQESRLIWVQKGRVTHRLLKNDVEVKSPNRMPPYKSPSPATPGGLQGPQTTGRGIYAWGNSQSLLASETSGKDRHGICLGIGLLDMSTCKLARESHGRCHRTAPPPITMDCGA